MERLRAISRIKAAHVDTKFSRYLLKEIDWSNRLIAIKGARGVGKTTLILQYLKEQDSGNGTILYASLDDIYFAAHSLVEFAESFYREGGLVLLLDEVHKYPNWSREIKNLYDSYPDLRIVFTGSSILQLYKAYADLSRRVVAYDLQTLSFREYLAMTGVMNIPPIALDDILENHSHWEDEIVQQIKPLKHFRDYLQFGVYPYFIENRESYHQKLLNAINLTIDYDLPSAQQIEYSNLHKIKKLLYILATSVPFTPNISKLSEQTLATRATVMQYLGHLQNAQIINMINTDSMGTAYLTKPEKIYLHNTNLMYAIAPEMINTGSQRETFLYNQLAQKHSLTLPKSGDFLVDKKYTIEVGGRNKKQGQIAEVPNSFIAVDEIEFGFKNKIPLWLFGFLY